MSLIMGALGGMGEQGVNIAQSNTKLWNEETLNAQRSDLETKRQMALEQFKNELGIKTADQLRTAQVDRIGTAQRGIVGQAIDSKYAPSDAAVAAADAGQTDAPLTDEQKAVIAQSKDLDRKKLMDSPDSLVQAAMQTGDISPKDVMTNTSKTEINQAKMDNLLARASDRNETMQAVAQIRADAITAAAQLRVDAANQRATTGKIDNATGRMLITSEDANIKASTSQMGMLQRELQDLGRDTKSEARRKDIQGQIEGLREDISQSKSNKESYLKSMGLMSSSDKPPTEKDVKAATKNDAQSAAPTSKPISALPPGAKQVGTSGGVPVYETPDGKRFIQQ